MDGVAIERDLVLKRYRRAEGGRLAVYRHAARESRGFRLAARGRCAGPGEERLQAHYGVSPASSGGVAADVRRSCTRESSSGETREPRGGKAFLGGRPAA